MPLFDMLLPIAVSNLAILENFRCELVNDHWCRLLCDAGAVNMGRRPRLPSSDLVTSFESLAVARSEPAGA